MRLELVRDWMSREVVTATPEMPAVEAGNLMVERDIRRLPVLSGGQVVGIVTLADIRADQNDSSKSQAVANVMAGEPLTVGEDETIGRAAQLMLVNKVGGLPVLNVRGELAGMITESDIFRLVVHDWMHAAGDESEPYARYG